MTEIELKNELLQLSEKASTLNEIELRNEMLRLASEAFILNLDRTGKHLTDAAKKLLLIIFLKEE